MIRRIIANSFLRFPWKDTGQRIRSIATLDVHRLRYAALELRDAMEAVTYDRALAFKDEIPPEEYRTWQPRKLMAVLVDIDPSIGMTTTIAVGIESEYGKPAENMETLGTDQVLTLKDVKTHYDAIGSHLHMPSLEQLETGKIADPAKLRTRCEAVVAALEAVLSSPVHNGTLGDFALLAECMNEACRRPVRKRIPHGKTEIEAECFECKATYTVVAHPGGVVEFKPKVTLVGCPLSGLQRLLRRPHSEWQHFQSDNASYDEANTHYTHGFPKKQASSDHRPNRSDPRPNSVGGSDRKRLERKPKDPNAGDHADCGKNRRDQSSEAPSIFEPDCPTNFQKPGDN
jgi:hypothetical protein